MLKLEDLKIGMEVNIEELDEIYDIVVIVSNFISSYRGYICYIGERGTDELNNMLEDFQANNKPYYIADNYPEYMEVSYDE